MLGSDGANIRRLVEIDVRPSCIARLELLEIQVLLERQEALMASMRSDRASARARDLLATLYPLPDDFEFRRLRELAIDYIQEAERLEAENRGRAAEADELISAALDAVARDYFARALARATSQKAR
jgi:hypothetical protein